MGEKSLGSTIISWVILLGPRYLVGSTIFGWIRDIWMGLRYLVRSTKYGMVHDTRTEPIFRLIYFYGYNQLYWYSLSTTYQNRDNECMEQWCSHQVLLGSESPQIMILHFRKRRIISKNNWLYDSHWQFSLKIPKLIETLLLRQVLRDAFNLLNDRSSSHFFHFNLPVGVGRKGMFRRRDCLCGKMFFPLTMKVAAICWKSTCSTFYGIESNFPGMNTIQQHSIIESFVTSMTLTYTYQKISLSIHRFFLEF